MQTVDLVITHEIPKTARVMQLTGMMDFNSPITEHKIQIDDIDLETEWGVGLIVGASGSGKTTIARELFGDSMYEPTWGDKALVDEFPKDYSVKEIIGGLIKVGLGSVPAWLRPYHTLSNGEKFRADIARTLFLDDQLICIDEFTSVVDRTVAKVASNSVQKVFRERGKQLVAVSCHYDIIDWLQPDWIMDVQERTFRRCLRRGRPPIDLRIVDTDWRTWEGISHHHYMTGKINKAAQCIAAYHEDRMIGFSSYLHLPHPRVRNMKIGHRTVVIPDYQGLGIGLALDNFLGEMLKREGMRFVNTTGHPALIRGYQRSPLWKTTRYGKGVMTGRTSSITKSNKARQKRARLATRATASFEYVGT